MTNDSDLSFNLPQRKYCEGPKKLFSVRLPEILLKEIDRIAKRRQWDTSEVVMTALDQFAQWEARTNKARR